MEYIENVVFTFALLSLVYAIAYQPLSWIEDLYISYKMNKTVVVEEAKEECLTYYVVDGKYDMKRIMSSAHEYRKGTEGCNMSTALRKTWNVAMIDMARYQAANK